MPVAIWFLRVQNPQLPPHVVRYFLGIWVRCSLVCDYLAPPLVAALVTFLSLSACKRWLIYTAGEDKNYGKDMGSQTTTMKKCTI